MQSNSSKPQSSNIERFLTKTRNIDITPSREQGPAKRPTQKWSDIVASKESTSEATIADPQPTVIGKDTVVVADPPAIKNTANPSKTKESSKSPNTTKSPPIQVHSSDEEDEDDEEEEVTFSSIFPPPQDAIKDLTAFSHRFVFNMNIEFSDDPKTILKQTAKMVNKGLSLMKSYMHFHGIPGKLNIIPWEDEYVYNNRILPRLKIKDNHETLLSTVKMILWNYGGPYGRKAETIQIKKYTRIQVAILHDDPLTESQQSLAKKMYNLEIPSQQQFFLLKCASQAISPTVAVQFRQSFCRNPSNWKDKGQEDCFEELDAMISRQLPSHITAGLKRYNLVTGTPYMKNDPNLVSLECDTAHEKQVTRDMLSIFKPTTRRDQVREQCSVPWIAIPFFKGQDMQGDKRFTPEYMEIKAKERTYQEDLSMRYMSDILRVDDSAPETMHLSKEMLKQLENTIWENGETPIRALIYDKLWDDIKETLKTEWLKKQKVSEITEDWIKKANEAISVQQILQKMNSLGYPTLAPYDSQSFPTPNPSKRTLREFLMSIKSRRHADLKSAPYVFESVNKTDDGRVLFSFVTNNADEACTILENLPLFIQHEMHLDPSFFLSSTLLHSSQGNYYNPLTRTGITAVARSLTENKKTETNLRSRIPKGIRSSSAQQLEELFKRKENCMFSFKEEDNLHSLAESVSSYKVIPEKSVREVEAVMSLQTLLSTHYQQGHQKEDISVLSDGSSFSFDSQTSRARYEIEKRAETKVQEALKISQLQQAVTLHKIGQLSQEVAIALNINMQEVMDFIEKEDTENSSKSIENATEKTTLPAEEIANPETWAFEMDDIQISQQMDDLENEEMSVSSDKTEPTGSPSKQAPGGLNTGLSK
jgi:hypothetical protein